MPNLNRNFIKGAINKDLDERLLPDGMIRHGENILIINSESSDVGSIQNSYSNKRLTNYNFGENPKCLLGCADETNDMLYWFILSDTGAYLVEWDNKNLILSIVLGDTRPPASRVFNLSEKHLITGIGKIINEDRSNDLFTWTDDNIEPCCINIERAKTYGINGFEKEDIYLIKKPPRFAPKLVPILQNTQSNNMEDKFFSFCYRYKYLDGEYSALSDYANYQFTPRNFELDYFTLDNVGMLNKYNAVKIGFNTGDKRVTDIQLVVKESNSNNLYVIETFSKEKEGWGDGQTKHHIFSNNKVYKILPENELFRSFDNVPLKAKALTLIGNRIVFGNYLEGFDMVDSEGKKVVIDYALSLVNENISEALEFTMTFGPDNVFEVTNPDNHPLTAGSTLNFTINVLLDGQDVYNNDFSLILENDYASLVDLINSEEFEIFFGVINSDYVTNYNTNQAYEVQYGWVVTVETELQYEIIGGVPTFTVTPVTFEDTFNSNEVHVVDTSFSETTLMDITASSNAQSCKTNRDYEVGVVYEEGYNRKCTVLTAPYNTIYIPQQYSVFKNKIRVTLNHKPPYWADRYKLVVKAKPLQYQTIYINEFYNEDFYVWCRLIAENKDKVKVGDEIIIKRAASQIINSPIKVKVLEIKEREKDFIIGNKDKKGVDIVEPAGLYMKINPNGFSMDFNDYQIYNRSVSSRAGNGHYPIAFVDLFSETIDNPDPTPDTYEDIAIPSGSSIYIYIHSGFNYKRGWRNTDYIKTYFAQRDYDTLEDWFNENVIGKNLFADDNFGDVRNYKDNVALKRGFLTYSSPFNIPSFTENPLGKLYLWVKGTESGGSGGRSGYLDVTIRIRTSVGVYVFETNPKQAETQIYYETEQAFEIVDGNHTSNNQDQDIDAMVPAIIDLDFFNCYTQGNGVESYKVKDGFNKDYLNIDLRPSATSIEEYKAIRRKSDLTYGEPFVESTNVNGLNEFNVSTGNFKELDKQYGSIQKLHSRDGDIVVFQEEKTSKVLFGKDALYNADGSANLTSMPEVLGQQVFYLGENGIGKNPESFGMNDYQIYYANPLKGIVQRLSMDGVEPITNGMVDYFRDLFIQKPFSKKLGAFDPYHKQFFISVGEEPDRIYELQCGNSIIKDNVDAPFSYNFNINDLVGDIVLNYNIISGNATITALYDGDVFVASNVTGVGNITIPRTNVVQKIVSVTITPVGGAISFEIANICPLGIPLTVVSIVLNDNSDIGKTIINRYRWGGNNFYSENDLFNNEILTRFNIDYGIEGVGRFPDNGTIVNMQSYKDSISTGEFEITRANKLSYLITEDVYTESDIETIRDLSTDLSVSETIDGFSNITTQGNFLFSRANENEILYLIWDYCSMPYDFEVDNYSDTQIRVKWKGNKSCVLTLINNDTEEEIVITTNFNEYLFSDLSPYTDYTITLKPICCEDILTINLKTMITRKIGSFDIGDIGTAINFQGSIDSVTTTPVGDWDAGHSIYQIIFDSPVETDQYVPIVAASDITGDNSSSLSFAVNDRTVNGFKLDVRDVAVASDSYGIVQNVRILIQVS